MDLEKLINEWNDYCFAKEAYLFGDEIISEEDFADLVSDTYNAILTARSTIEKGGSGEEFNNLCMDYAGLGVVLGKYAYKLSAIEDESEDRFCSVTQLMADLLANLMTSHEIYGDEKNGIINMPYAIDDVFYKYDINEGDFSEVIAFIDAEDDL